MTTQIKTLFLTIQYLIPVQTEIMDDGLEKGSTNIINYEKWFMQWGRLKCKSFTVEDRNHMLRN